MPVKRLLTVGLVSLSLVISSCALIEGEEATTTTIDEWTLDAFTDLVAFCQRNFESSAEDCPYLITAYRDDFNCTVEGTYLLFDRVMALSERDLVDTAEIREARIELCGDPSTP